MKKRIEIEQARNGWMLAIGTVTDRSNPLGNSDQFEGIWVFTSIESVLEFIRLSMPGATP